MAHDSMLAEKSAMTALDCSPELERSHCTKDIALEVISIDHQSYFL